MESAFFEYIETVNEYLWNYCGAPIILGFGLYLAYVSRLELLRHARKVWSIFIEAFSHSDDDAEGVSPLRTFFASLSGCIGLENIVGICTAIQIGGPGAIVWMWITIMLGMLIKYAEIYLGFIYRVSLEEKGYEGGPLYYLTRVKGKRYLPLIFGLMICIYATDIYVFRIVTSTLVTQWGINKMVAIILFLGIIVFAGSRGIDRLGKIAAIIIPLFTFSFIAMCIFVFSKHWERIPEIVILIFSTAFKGHAVVGGVAGSAVWIAMLEGMKKACYMADIGVGYAGMVHAESRQNDPHKEAILGMMGIFLNTFLFCSMSVFLILITDIWKEPLTPQSLVVRALSRYIPYIGSVWPLFIMMLGYSTLVSYYVVSKKVVEKLFPRWGKHVHQIYVVTAFVTFSFVGNEAHLMTIVSTAGLLLLIINMYAIIYLRKDISFQLK